MDNTTFASRTTGICSAIKRMKCDVLLISDSVNAEYLSGFHSSNVFLVLSAHKRFLCTDFRYRSEAEAFVRKNPLWEFCQIEQNRYSFLSRVLPPRSRCAIESDTMTVEEFDRISRECPHIKFKPIPGIATAFTSTKTTAEITAIKNACKIVDQVFARLPSMLSYGMTEQMLARKMDLEALALGSSRPAFSTIALFGERSALPHGVPSAKKLKKGDWILLDFGATISGLYSDITRTCVAGKASPRHHEIYAIVHEAQHRACKAAGAGMTAYALDKVARDYIAAAGYGAQFGHGTGHGVGRRIHEAPRVSPTDKSPLLPGMVYTIEPGIYIPDFGGVRIEDTVVQTSSRAIPLTRASHALLEIDI